MKMDKHTTTLILIFFQEKTFLMTGKCVGENISLHGISSLCSDNGSWQTNEIVSTIY